MAIQLFRRGAREPSGFADAGNFGIREAMAKAAGCLRVGSRTARIWAE
jgi:hypothetical protein